MSKHRQVTKHLKSLSEIKEIMSSMKTLSMLELRKLSLLISNQERIVSCCEQMTSDFISYFPLQQTKETGTKNCLIVVGSERGFCGDFNEQLLELISTNTQQPNKQYDAIIAVGQKLCTHLENHPQVVARLDGVSVTEESGDIIQNILNTFEQLQTESSYGSLQVMYYQHDTQAVATLSLLPPFENLQATSRQSYPPMLNLPPNQFFSELVEQTLFFRLHEIFYSSLKTENEQRIKHLDAAIERLEKESEQLEKKGRMLRQEEITEEIEIILLNSSPARKDIFLKH